MPKADRNPKAKTLTPRESGYLFLPWSCNHHPAWSEIVAYVPITGEWEIIADIHDAKGVDAEVVAGLIARAVNSYPKHHDMIVQMTAALELCLECGKGLTWEAEHEAQILVRRAREMG
jgi:hypothetical protein